MKLSEVAESEKELYNNFIANQMTGSFLQSWEWGSWQESLGRKVFRYWILDDARKQIGAVQLIKMPIAGSKFYLYAPYGPVMDLGFNIEDLRFIKQELHSKFTEAVFIRLEPKDQSLASNLSSLASKSPNIQPAKTLLIDLTKPENELLAEMHPKTRYNIKVAQKHGVEINDEFAISIGHGLFFEEALKLILETSQRQKFNTFSADYYKKLADFFLLRSSSGNEIPAEASAKAETLYNHQSLHLHIYKAVYKNQLLASAIILDFGEVRTFLFGGSSNENKNIMAPYLLHWTAMSDAKTLGLKTYDFWGIETASGEVPGFVRFKLGFGGMEKAYSGAHDIVINKPLYQLYKLARRVNKLFRF